MLDTRGCSTNSENAFPHPLPVLSGYQKECPGERGRALGQEPKKLAVGALGFAFGSELAVSLGQILDLSGSHFSGTQ